jgi:hypothetical protein
MMNLRQIRKQINESRDKNVLIFALISLLSIGVLSTVSYAAFEDKGTGARGTALGDTYVAMGDDILSLAYNPAALARVRQKEVTSEYAKLFAGLSDGSSLSQTYLAYGQPVSWGGTLAASWKQFGLDDLYKERTLSLGYGEWLTSEIAIGAAVKQLHHSFGVPNIIVDNSGNIQSGTPEFFAQNGNSQTAYSADLGMLYRWTDKHTLGISIQDINQPNIALSSDDHEIVPRTLRIGMSYARNRYLQLAAAIQSREYLNNQRDTIATGAAERFWKMQDGDQVSLRGSFAAGSREYRQFAFGSGYEMGSLSFDYAFVFNLGGITLGDTSGTHRFSMNYRFGQILEPPKPILSTVKPKQKKPVTKAAAPAPKPSRVTQTVSQEMKEMEALIEGREARRSSSELTEHKELAAIMKGKAPQTVAAPIATEAPNVDAPAEQIVPVPVAAPPVKSIEDLLMRVSAMLKAPARERAGVYATQFDLWKGYFETSRDLAEFMEFEEDLSGSARYYEHLVGRNASDPERSHYLMLSMEKYLETILVQRSWNLQDARDLRYKAWLHLAWSYQRSIPERGLSMNEQIASLQRLVAKAMRFEQEPPEPISSTAKEIVKPQPKRIGVPVVKPAPKPAQKIQADKTQAQVRYEKSLLQYSKKVAAGATLSERIVLLRKILANCQQTNLDCRLAYQEFEATFDEELRQTK